MKFLILLSSLLFVVGCATDFKPSKNGGFGYTVNKFKEPKLFTHYSSFIGNTQTRQTKAKAYSRLAAVLHCEKEKKVAVLSSSSINASKSF
ncbi:MAG: hypothetical protein HRT44_04670 [Bdellovibrionales bacterium]|nr:hypothetical protein [Bdellovibrionales bacterium]NQZ18536.1 hypothetical protein [Bdellovibrionales bacterium]